MTSLGNRVWGGGESGCGVRVDVNEELKKPVKNKTMHEKLDRNGTFCLVTAPQFGVSPVN